MGSFQSWRDLRPGARPVLCVLALALVSGCRKGQDQQAATFIPLGLPTDGNHGCATPAQIFNGGANLPPVDLGGFVVGDFSRVVSASNAPLLFLTGANADVLELDVTDPDLPVPRTLVSPGLIDALIASLGISQPAQLSGLAVVDAGNLVVVEHTSNTLLLVSRLIPDTVTLLAGFPVANGGFADGIGSQVRFNFAEATTLVPTDTGVLYVADSGNHAIRQVVLGALSQVTTVAGTGAPGYSDGSLGSTQFDTPTGLAIGCDGRLFVSETGEGGLGGHRLRALSIGAPVFFGGFSGFCETLAGDGNPVSTEGSGVAAQLAGPSALFGNEDGEVYFVDGLTGHLRRFDMGSGLTDCPLEATGCSLPTGLLVGSANVGLTVSSQGDLFFLLGSQGTLLRYIPN